MTKSACVEFYEKYLNEVSKGHGYRGYTNPAITFSNAAKRGDYNAVSDEEYDILLDDAKALSEFWLNKPEQSAAEVLQVALEDIDIDKASLHKMAEILSECYQASVAPFALEELKLKSAALEEDSESEDFMEMPSDYKDELPFPNESDFDYDASETEEDTENGLDNSASKPEPRKKRETPELRHNFNSRKLTNETLDSQRKIYEWIEKYIYGQKEAVKAAAILLHNHIHGRKRNALFVGPTGCGKTEIWRVCQRIYPNIRIIDGTMITAQGWKGDYKIENVFDNMTRLDAENAIIVIDEFDKLCESQIGSGGTDYSHLVQNNLLKFIEGTEIQVKNENSKKHSYTVDTSNISFVLCGSFERLTEMKTAKEAGSSLGFGAKVEKTEARLVYESEILPEDLVKYANIRQEIAGRINQIVQLSPMTAEDFKCILKDEEISPLRQMEKLYDIKLSLEKGTEEKLVQVAEATHMGVRYLRSRIQKMLDDMMFQDEEQGEYVLSA